MEELAIKIEHVSKQYRLGLIGGGTLQADIESWWARKHGKEDPNSKIGAENKKHKVGEKFLALDDINLEVKKGEALGIIGHNGAGKSTLLKLLSRVTAPTEGTISYNGRITSMLEVGTGFHRELTGRENIYMNGAILGMSRKETESKIEQIIDFSEVRQFIDTPVKRYSSGMYVKLAFSVAAHLDSEIMIMDEVLAVGDMAFQKKCLTKMREVAHKEGRTVLYVSHNMNTIRQLCDRCVVLDHGRIIFDGDVEEAINCYLGIKGSDDRSVYHELKDRPRNFQFGKKLRVCDFTFLGKEQAVFEVGEPIRFKVGLESQVDVENARLVLSIKTDDYRQIGMALSKPFSIPAGSAQQFEFEANLSNLAHGNYCLNFEIIDVDETGQYYSYDNPGTRIFFQLENEFAHGIKWQTKYWANVSFPEVEVVNCNEYDNQ